MTNRTCSIDGCDDDARARGWCMKHYKRWRKHGDPTALPARKLPPQNLPKRVGCEVEGCDETHQARGFCKRHYMQARYWEDPEKHREACADYRRNPARREEAKERSRAWREDNAERVREGQRKWRKANRDREREMKRAYREKNRDLIRAANNRRKAAIRGAAVSDLTAQQWNEIKAAWRNRCAYCGTQSPLLTMDHYIAIASGGHHTANNVVPACLTCNTAKGDRPAPPFYFEETAA